MSVRSKAVEGRGVALFAQISDRHTALGKSYLQVERRVALISRSIFENWGLVQWELTLCNTAILRQTRQKMPLSTEGRVDLHLVD